MKNSLFLILSALLIAVLAGCSSPVLAPSATLAATAAVPEQTPAQPTDGSEPAPAEATAPPEAPAATPVPPTATAVPPTATPEPSPTPAGPTLYTYTVVAQYPHDTAAWTEGLDLDAEQLYEGTGEWGASSLREVQMDTGQVLRNQPLGSEYYGEGVTVLGDKIYQLTWQQNTAFVYDKATFQQVGTFEYPTEGWGLTNDGQRLIMSDGTATIYFRDPATFEELGRIEVRDDKGPVIMLNELEWVNGEIWANVWLTDRIARIDPTTGQVTGWIDMGGLLDPASINQPVDVLNGIAYNETTGQIYVTGKYWPSLFEIQVVPAGQ